MKTLNSLVVTSVIAAGFASSAFANTVSKVYIVGAPAYRQDSNSNLATYVAGFSGAGITATSAPSTSDSDIKSASANQWLIPNFSTGVDLEINASYTGSSSGIESVASGSITQKFIADATGTVASPSVVQAVATAYQPDFTLSDTFQNTTPFTGTVTLKGPTNITTFTKTYQTLSFKQLGIEPYKFIASPGATVAGLTNITTAQAQALFKNGQLPLAFFTGKSADEGKWVYGVTRDPGSGARLVAVAETGIGTKSLITTYKPTVSGGTVDSSGNRVNGTITDAFDSIPLYPKGLIASTGVWDNNDGDTGYPKFGTPADQNGLLLAITSTPPAGALLVGYFNVADGNEAENAGAVELTYNGNLFSNTSVAEGLYTFWSYESIFYASTISGNPATVATWLKNNWVSTTPLSSVNVTRTADGGIVTGTYY